MNCSFDIINILSDDVYLYIMYLALERYSLFTDEFYKLNCWKEIINYPYLFTNTYVALDLWFFENFKGLKYDKHIEAKRILSAFLNYNN